jgi:hypothetical protein
LKKRLAKVQDAQKRFGPSQPFLERETFVYGDFSRLIE